MNEQHLSSTQNSHVNEHEMYFDELFKTSKLNKTTKFIIT
jgi:hypothetical protein